MKKLFFILFLVVFQNTINAQSNKFKSAFETSGWYTVSRLIFLPIEELPLPFRVVSTSSDYGIKQAYIIPIHEKLRLSFGAGITFSYYEIRIGNRLLEFSKLLDVSYTPVSGDEDIFLFTIQNNTNHITSSVAIQYPVINKPGLRIITSLDINQLFLRQGAVRVLVRDTNPSVGFFVFPKKLEETHGLFLPINNYFTEMIRDYSLTFSLGLMVEYRIVDNFWLGHNLAYQQNLINKNTLITKEQGIKMEGKLLYRF